MSSGVDTSLAIPRTESKRCLDFARNDKTSMNDDLESKIETAIKNPQNLGEMKDADAVGTVGSEDCGDMLRMWIKFKEKDGRKIIDRATFQSFGCQTAIAVASVATEMLKGKTADEAKSMSGEELASPLGPLPPVKIHCAQLVEGALRSALSGEEATSASGRSTAPSLAEKLNEGSVASGKVKVVLRTPD
jgi:nitrogen fixation protein NifU and related proteins